MQTRPEGIPMQTIPMDVYLWPLILCSVFVGTVLVALLLESLREHQDARRSHVSAPSRLEVRDTRRRDPRERRRAHGERALLRALRSASRPRMTSRSVPNRILGALILLVATAATARSVELDYRDWSEGGIVKRSARTGTDLVTRVVLRTREHVLAPIAGARSYGIHLDSTADALRLTSIARGENPVLPDRILPPEDETENEPE